MPATIEQQAIDAEERAYEEAEASAQAEYEASRARLYAALPGVAEAGNAAIALTRLPTLKELQAVEEIVGELLYREQMDSLDRKRGIRGYD